MSRNRKTALNSMTELCESLGSPVLRQSTRFEANRNPGRPRDLKGSQGIPRAGWTLGHSWSNSRVWSFSCCMRKWTLVHLCMAGLLRARATKVASLKL